MDVIAGDIQGLIGIIIVDLVLSGDNAVVIGMAARNLDEVNRRKAILWGGVGAVGLRVAFTILAALLLDVPMIHAAGAVLLVWIAWRLIVPQRHHAGEGLAAAGSLGEAVRTIVLADVVMSLDNILAVGGASDGNLPLLIFGLALSVPLLLFGSSLIARLLSSYPWLMLVGVAVLIHAAVSMFVHDRWIEAHTGFSTPEWLVVVFSSVLTAVIVASVWRVHGDVEGIGSTSQGS